MDDPFACIKLMTRLAGAAEAAAAATKLGNHRDYLDGGAQAWNLVSIGRFRLRAHPLSTPVFGHAGVVTQLLLRLISGAVLIVQPDGFTGMLSLAIIAVVTAAFNYRDSYLCEGASDRLRQIVVLALLLRFLAPDSPSACIATIMFTAFNAAGSYALSVFPKLGDPEWRDGRKAFHVLNSPFYGSGCSTARWLSRHPAACRMLTWQILLFELCFPLSLLWGAQVSVFFLVAGTSFHGVNRKLLKLPGFTLAYGITYPAILYLGRN